MSFFRYLAPVLALSFATPVMAADYVYATRDVTARRWQDNEVYTSGDVKTNDRLEVVFKTDAWVRVRLPRSPKFGWLPLDAVTETAPVGVETEPAPGAGGLDGMSPEIQQMIQQKMLELQQQQGGAGGETGAE